jgi:hypothetical protein
MTILCRRCERPAVGSYDTDLLCLDCMAVEIRRDRVEWTPLATARIEPPGYAA